MSASRIRTGGPAGEPVPHQIIDDHDWVQAHRTDLIQQYGECYVIVYQHQVIGTGRTYDDVLKEAEQNLPPEIDDLPVMVEWVGKRLSLHSIRRSQDIDS